jgi:Aldehyde dehydrogenase family
LTQSLSAIALGDAEDWATQINPLITVESRQRLLKKVTSLLEEVQRLGGTVYVNRVQEALEKPSLVGPLLVELPPEVLPESKAWRDEFFAPVLIVVRSAGPVSELVQLANESPYSLTGGLYSQLESDWLQALTHQTVGNLYLNRSITGARVGVEPFGGYSASGTGPKAGSPFYLSAFQRPQTEGFSNLAFDWQQCQQLWEAQRHKRYWEIPDLPGQRNHGVWLPFSEKIAVFCEEASLPDWILSALYGWHKVLWQAEAEDPIPLEWVTETASRKDLSSNVLKSFDVYPVLSNDIKSYKLFLIHGTSEFITNTLQSIRSFQAEASLEAPYSRVITSLNAPAWQLVSEWVQQMGVAKSVAHHTLRHGADLPSVF